MRPGLIALLDVAAPAMPQAARAVWILLWRDIDIIVLHELTDQPSLGARLKILRWRFESLSAATAAPTPDGSL
jgi:hypothetical protein